MTELKPEPEHLTNLIVSEAWLDSFGHVNNARYLELYEQARWNWLIDGGIDIQTIKSTGIGPVILEINLRFRKELLARQEIQIRSWCASYRKKILVIRQEMWIQASEEIASEITLTAGLMDLNQRKLIEPPPHWQQAMGIPWEA